MARFDPDEQAAALGEALAALRRDAGLSQAEAGARIGMTSQGWGLYESGRRPGLFRPDVQRRLTGALGSTPEALAQRLAQPKQETSPAPVDGVRSGGRSFAPAPRAEASTGVERVQLSNDELAPWAASGVILEFDFDRWPRRDQGCVIDLVDGRRLVRLYHGADGDRLYLRGGPGGLTAESVIARAEVARLGAVRARLDQ